ncbi:hypothetical protein SNL152K_10554 [Streptomyces sp. NL15-2K]|nr:hypothetical protein SNL152K_10554 [Streptomyces sp. NL15-2K]
MGEQTGLHQVPVPVPQPRPTAPPPQGLDLAQRLRGRYFIEQAGGGRADDLVRQIAQHLPGTLTPSRHDALLIDNSPRRATVVERGAWQVRLFDAAGGSLFHRRLTCTWGLEDFRLPTPQSACGPNRYLHYCYALPNGTW